jgi:hypothetical protein
LPPSRHTRSQPHLTPTCLTGRHLSLRRRPELASLFIHPSAWKGDSAKFAWPRSYAESTHGRLMSSPGVGTSDRGYGYLRVCYVPRANTDKRRSAVPTSGGRSVPKCLLTARRRAPGAPAPQQDDPGRCEAELDPLGAFPALLPARVAADVGVEPHAWTLGL